MLENFKESVEGLESTNESVLSHRLNDVLRILTAVTVILLPLTLVTGFFGMNVGFPGDPRAPGLLLGRRGRHGGHARGPRRLLPPAWLGSSARGSGADGVPDGLGLDEVPNEVRRLRRLREPVVGSSPSTAALRYA